MTRKQFLSQHWELVVAADFFTIEVRTAKGLQQLVVLFFIEISTRRVEIAGISASANGLWMSQIARNLTDSVDGLLTGKRHLIHERDSLFTQEFLRTLKDANVAPVKLPPRSPNLNAHAEKFVRSIKESYLDRLILFGESSLRTAVQNFITPYHSERNHQGLDNRIIQPETGHATNTGAIHRRERLGGALNTALCDSGFASTRSLGETLQNEIGRMWRFTRNNGITEGFHTKMEVLQRQAYDFRNFRNYRLRVVVMRS